MSSDSSSITNFLFGAVIVIWLIFMLVKLSIFLRSYLKSLHHGLITNHPKIPEWSLSPGIIRRSIDSLIIYTQPYDKPYHSADKTSRFSALGAVKRWILARTGVQIPDEACVVQVPMEGFTCGQDPTDFEGPRGPLTYHYQMFGDDRIQVVTFQEDDVEKVAGYCIYIKDPYGSGVAYNWKVLEKCYQIDKELSVGSV